MRPNNWRSMPPRQGSEDSDFGSRENNFIITRSRLLRLLDPEDEDTVVNERVGKEVELLAIYSVLYIAMDFSLFMTGYHNNKTSNLNFISVIALSIVHDLRSGPVYSRHLKERIHTLAKIVIFLFCIVFGFACISNQFLVPVEIEVVDNVGGEVLDPASLEASETQHSIIVWSLMYRGFIPKVASGYSKNRDYFKDDMDLDTDDNYYGDNLKSNENGKEMFSTAFGFHPNHYEELEPLLIRVLIHIAVDATKFAIGRLLVLEAEWVVNMLEIFTWSSIL